MPKIQQGFVMEAGTGKPLLMAKIRGADKDGNIVGSSGAYTDQDGKFNITLPLGTPNILVSFVGYEPKVIPVTGNMISVPLSPKTLNVVDVVFKGEDGTKKRNWWLIGGLSLAGLAVVGTIIYFATRKEKE